MYSCGQALYLTGLIHHLHSIKDIFNRGCLLLLTFYNFYSSSNHGSSNVCLNYRFSPPRLCLTTSHMSNFAKLIPCNKMVGVNLIPTMEKIGKFQFHFTSSRHSIKYNALENGFKKDSKDLTLLPCNLLKSI